MYGESLLRVNITYYYYCLLLSFSSFHLIFFHLLFSLPVGGWEQLLLPVSQLMSSTSFSSLDHSPSLACFYLLLLVCSFCYLPRLLFSLSLDGFFSLSFSFTLLFLHSTSSFQWRRSRSTVGVLLLSQAPFTSCCCKSKDESD